MKGLGKQLVGFFLVTAVLLLYVHERVEMLRVSYRIYKKSAQVSNQAEEYRRLRFEVAELRSPESLEKRLQELPLALTLPKEIKVLKVPRSEDGSVRASVPVQMPAHNPLRFLGQWIQVAQARTDQ